MARKTGKQRAAANREAIKQNKPPPFQKLPEKDTSLDPSYILEPAPDDSELELQVEGTSQDPILAPSKRGGKRKTADADLDPAGEKPNKVSCTTQWRLDNGKTALARRTNSNFQPGIASLFKSVPNPRKVAARQESEEPDSDIEIIENPSMEMKNQVEAAQEANIVSPQLSVSEPIGCTDDDVEMLDNFELSPSISDVVETQKSASVEPVGISELPSPPAAAAASSDQPNVPAVSLPNETEVEIKAKHARLQKIIKKNRIELTKKLSILTSASAAASVLDLEALAQFNDKSLQLSLKRLCLIKSVPGASRLMRPLIRRKIKACSPTMEASAFIASRCGKGDYYARSLRKIAAHLLEHGTLPEKQQGKGAHHKSFLLNPRVCEALKEWVKGTLEVEEGGFVGRMRPAKMRRYVNDFLLPQLKIEDTISESTAVRWLKKMGFRLARVQKGVYVDGHEQPDIVESRDKFIEYIWLKILPFCYAYEDEEPAEGEKPSGNLIEIPPVLGPGDKIHYPISHDECCVHANDQVNFEWLCEGEQPLRQKSRGRIVHISSFVMEHCGTLSLTPEEIAVQLKLLKEPLPPTASPIIEANAPAPSVPYALPTAAEPVPLQTPSPAPPAAAPVEVETTPTLLANLVYSDMERTNTRSKRIRRPVVRPDAAEEEDDESPLLDEVDGADQAWAETSRNTGSSRRATAPKKTAKATAKKSTATKKSKLKRGKAVDPEVPKQGRTYAENDWVPPPPPAPYTAYQIPSFDACRIIYPGVNHDPWWDMPQLIAQVKDAIKIFDVKYPDGVAVFIFDCSSAHKAYSSDALQAHKMNRSPGGKQLKMHDTIIPSTGQPQQMNFPDDYTGKDSAGNSLAGQPKGMEQVLHERGLLQSLEAKHGSGRTLLEFGQHASCPRPLARKP
ncbi:hypothetical protein B0H17DRAFT_1207904 [Mycena rosella]|uniref:Uncharacterized protein n=1 Tax=Mycena rosella TaxID=1033263 RepID=A0AAD7GA08_MYCRO|nr:hypothetical protein B0H17DRAFT_1207904 [Mycena rosella]